MIEVLMRMQATARGLDRRHAARVLAGIAIFVAALPAFADAGLKTSRIKVGPHPLKVEVAATEPQRMQGLMHRTALGKDEGMLFIFDELAYHSMWMKNTLIPLSVAYVDDGGRILNILDMEPQTLDSHMAAGPARYAIETNKGWFAAKKIKAGDKVTGLPGAGAAGR
jgi:uncharacterized membrane protein (UPF0127 family)